MKFILPLLFAIPAFALAQPTTKAKPKAKQLNQKPQSIAPPKNQQDTSAPFVLIVNTVGIKDSTIAVIVNQNNQQFQGPFGYVKNNRVVLTGALPQTDMYLLVLTDGKTQNNDRYYNTFLENQHYEIEVNSNSAEMYVVRGNTLKVFNQLIALFGSDFDALTQITQQKQALAQSGQPADSLNMRETMVKDGIKRKIPSFLQTNNDSEVAAFLLQTTKPMLTLDELAGYFAMLHPNVKSGGFGSSISEFVQTEKATGEGQIAPDFTQNDPAGKPISLSDFKGKYVLVDFWASWCGPCRVENPNVVSAYNAFKDKNFTVLGVSFDTDKTKWVKAIEADKLAWAQISDLQGWANAAGKQYKISSIPQNILVGPDGKIIAKNLRGGVLHSYLQQTLK